jgi:hypothetical protein
MKEQPKLTVDEMVTFLASPLMTNSYRKRCIKHFEKIHPPNYAKNVRAGLMKKLDIKPKNTTINKWVELP